MNFNKQLKDGLIYQNPVLVQVLGMCSTMAITTSVANGFGMGISVLIILTLSNIFISLLRKIIPNEVRIACYIVVIAGFVTIVDLCLQAFVPDIAESLGVFIPLIVVNCIIIGRAEAFCQKNPVGPSFFDGIFQGLGYTLVLIAMCVIRELLGKGSFGTGIFNTIGGVIGDIVSVKEDSIVIETTTDRVRVEFAKFAVSTNNTAEKEAAKKRAAAAEARKAAKAEKKKK